MTEEQIAIRDKDELWELIKLMTPKEQAEYLSKVEQEKVLKAKVNYLDYNRYVHPNWTDTKLAKFLCENIEKFLNGELLTEDGEEVDYLCLSCPPQVGKSMTITETIGSYVLGKRKFKDRIYDRTIALAYGEDLSRKFGKLNLNKVSEFGKKIFNIELDPNSKSVTDFYILGTNRSMISRGIMAGVTGNAGDLIIVDDPHKNMEEAMSESSREKIFDEFLASVESRLSAKGKVIVIHTRWDQTDLIGRITQNKAFRAVYYNFPLEAEENDILGREIGDPLVPEIGKDKAWLAKKKAIYMQKEGQRAWYALYQGRPTVQGGNIIQTDWIKKYTKEELPAFAKVIMSVDATFKDGLKNDFVSIGVLGKVGNKYYLIDEIHKRLNFPDTMTAIKRMKSEYSKISNILIEDKANGSAIIQMLKRELNMNGITAIEPKGGKIARLNAVSHLFESGQVYLPSDKEFFTEFVDELAVFPNGKHDDRADMISQALSYLLKCIAFVPTEQQAEQEEIRREMYFRKVKSLTGSVKRASKGYINFNG